MGWWTVTDAPEMEIGDTVLDDARRFLRSVSRSYEEDLKRKPSVAELEYLLTLAFSVNADSDVLSNFDELRVQEIKIKTGKRQKRVKPAIGDIFSFKVADELYAFGRLVSELRAGTIAEIFNYTSTQPILDPSFTVEWLIKPVLLNSFILLDQKSEGQWDIISKDPDYKPDKRFKDVFFSWKDYKNEHKLEGVFEQGVTTDEETAQKYPRYVTANDAKIREMVVAAIS
ncbi:Imm26 family immunity protein [Ochrobactrum sp. SFR4]|uniref:Imm26 family immunity protein n=1 Tax=Ochrobactrum sp. SFR4 TaxID=2717368 RepID=UPI001C8C1107|nr:Imm26 family immunity protein [Ochrobactrum sp. SFR4]MBX8827214.1 hypothetical protein [Ochrobactrum sp. SFR4]